MTYHNNKIKMCLVVADKRKTVCRCIACDVSLRGRGHVRETKLFQAEMHSAAN